MTELLQELKTHLDELDKAPDASPNVRLFDNCTVLLPRVVSKAETSSLVPHLASLVTKLNNDPTPVIELLSALLIPCTYAEILGLVQDIDFVGGLRTDVAAFNRLILAVLAKATTSTADVEEVASRPGVLQSLVNLWLVTPHIGIAGEAESLMLKLLAADRDPSLGKIWQGLLHDADITRLYFALASERDSLGIGISKSHRSLAQARLLSWVPKVAAMEWEAVAGESQLTVETSLLLFVSTELVDETDILMHQCLLVFYTELLGLSTFGPGLAHDTRSLDFLVRNGLHESTMQYYLSDNLEEADVQFLYGPSADYVAEYASKHTQEFLVDSACIESTLQRLRAALNLTASQWAHQPPSKHDLHVLTSLPRQCLLPQTANDSFISSPVSLLPTKQTHPDVLCALAVLFHGPTQDKTVIYPPESPLATHIDTRFQEESRAAKALYLAYRDHNPRMDHDLRTHIKTRALPELALAAEKLIGAIATVSWAT